ncbi:MAG: acyl-ACP--UDP-N-acetylglucosamine O-acyltransferase [Planctomycetes bacterium]|nr:acyl-ACP--UDP-N-acetylglucosamine O-acyltransferase [Planctomycetota bacterium]
MIHPTAVVDRRAEIAQDVEIGPHVVIDGPVKIGARSRLVAFVHVSGHTEIGSDNVIHPFAVIGHEPQHLGYKNEPTKLIIGNGNIIREHAEVHRGTVQGSGVTRIGNHNLIMGHAHVAHDCEIHDRVTLVNGALLGGHVVIHDRAFISGNVVVHQWSRIGTLAMVQGLGGVGKDVLPFSIASGIDSIVGTNVVGMRRAGLDADKREQIREVFRLFFHLPVPDAVAEATRMPQTAEIQTILDFIKGTKRGLCRFGRRVIAARRLMRQAMDEEI